MSLARFAALFLALLVGAMGVGYSLPGGQDAGDRAPVRVRELLTQRRAVMFQIERLQTERFAEGVGTSEEMIEASIDRLRAELELATERAQRVELLAAQVELARALEARVRAAAAAGRASRIDFLRAEAFRLGTEVELARVQ